MSTLHDQIDNIRAQLDANAKLQAGPQAIVNDRTERRAAIISSISEATAALSAARAPLGDALVAEATGGSAEAVMAIRANIAAAEVALDTANARQTEIEEFDSVIAALNLRVSQLAGEVLPLHDQLEHLRADQVREELAARMAQFDGAIGSIKKLAVAVFGCERYLSNVGSPPGIRTMATGRFCLPSFTGDAEPLSLGSIEREVAAEAQSLAATWGLANRAPQIRYT